MTSPITSVTPSYSSPGVIGGFTYGYDPASYEGLFSANLLTTGEEAFPRDLTATGAVTVVSGQLRLTYFTARKTETSTQCRILSGGTAAGATPTLCKIGIFEIAANGDGTLVGVTANDTALFAVASTAYTRSWVTPFTKTAGRRYAAGPLVVTAATAPSFVGKVISNSTEAGQSPVLTTALSGQTDIPASFSAGSLAGSNLHPYVAVLP
jgi:hypothetical protein